MHNEYTGGQIMKKIRVGINGFGRIGRLVFSRTE